MSNVVPRFKHKGVMATMKYRYASLFVEGDLASAITESAGNFTFA
jgi:hypothetical protein